MILRITTTLETAFDNTDPNIITALISPVTDLRCDLCGNIDCEVGDVFYIIVQPDGMTTILDSVCACDQGLMSEMDNRQIAVINQLSAVTRENPNNAAFMEPAAA